MRDYSFGNFLHELRKRRGLSQYQLGMLVGVSNKAVSKWENGSAKPQSRILYELSDVLGVTVDELLACKYHSIENGNVKGVFAMKKNELWKKAYQNLLEYYGEALPIEILNRYLSEYAELKNSDLIVYFDLAVSRGLHQAAKEWIHTYFAGHTIITLVRSDRTNLETIAIIEDAISDLSSAQELPFEKYYGRLKQYPTITWMLSDMFDTFRMLEKETGKAFGNADFTSSDVLNAFIRNDTKGILEFNSDFVRGMIDEISPESFNDLIQISGLSHGTGVWFDNAQQLIKKGLSVGKCLAYRDDVFNRVQEKLEAKNLPNTGYAYKLMEDTCRGIYCRDGVPREVKQQLADIGMEDWFSESIEKIQYAFPKAHGVLYVKYALILMWYKINFPKVFQKIINNALCKD